MPQPPTDTDSDLVLLLTIDREIEALERRLDILTADRKELREDIKDAYDRRMALSREIRKPLPLFAGLDADAEEPQVSDLDDGNDNNYSDDIPSKVTINRNDFPKIQELGTKLRREAL